MKTKRAAPSPEAPLGCRKSGLPRTPHGRPRLPDSVRKSKKVMIRVSEADYLWLQQVGTKRDCMPGSVVSMLVTERREPTKKTKPIRRRG